MGKKKETAQDQSENKIQVVPETIDEKKVVLDSPKEQSTAALTIDLPSILPQPNFRILNDSHEDQIPKQEQSASAQSSGLESDDSEQTMLALFGCPLDFGSTKGKGHEKPRKKKKLEKPEFKVKSTFDSPTKYKTTTSLPSSDRIRELWLLPKEISERILNTMADIYSHVARRGGKGGGTFFVNTVVTAEYELATNLTKGIKGKNHRLKTGLTAKTIEKTITQIENTLRENQTLEKEQKALLKIWRIWFQYQLEIYDKTIEKFSEADLARLEKDFGYSCEATEKLCLTPEKQVIRSMHPKTPEGKKSFPEANTPKSLTKPMQDSLAQLWNQKKPSQPEIENMGLSVLNQYDKHKAAVRFVSRKLFEDASDSVDLEKDATGKKINKL